MEQPAMEGSSRAPLAIIAAAILVVLAALGGWWVGRSTTDADPTRAQEPATPATIPEQETAPAEETTVDEIDPRWRAALDETLSWGAAAPSAEVCAGVDADLAEVCAESGVPCDLVKSAAISLARRPPTASGELYEHEDVVANVFHLFRTLGRRDVIRLRDALKGPGVDRELHALAFYRWLATREACGQGDEKALTLNVLNDYAVYGLSTLGGQAYLRRRSPSAEGLASFYALITLDRAIQSNKDEHGLDPRPFVPRVESLLDDESLRLRDDYRRALEGFRARWGGL